MLSKNNVNVGIIATSANPGVVLKPSDGTSEGLVFSKLNNLNKGYGKLNVNNVLAFSQDSVFNMLRKGVKTLLLFITTSPIVSNDITAAKDVLDDLKAKKDFKISVISIGDADPDALKNLTTLPGNVDTIKNSKDLPNVFDAIDKAIKKMTSMLTFNIFIFFSFFLYFYY